MSEFGKRLYLAAIVLVGRMDVGQWRAFIDEIVEATGMQRSYEPACWPYPLGGKGGNGQTMVQPITDSFIAVDTWPDHNGSYLVICSCKPFDRQTLHALYAKFGLTMYHEMNTDLGIPDAQRPL